VTPPRPRPWPTSSAAGPRRPRGALQPWANVTSLADRPDLRVTNLKVQDGRRRLVSGDFTSLAARLVERSPGRAHRRDRRLRRSGRSALGVAGGPGPARHDPSVFRDLHPVVASRAWTVARLRHQLRQRLDWPTRPSPTRAPIPPGPEPGLLAPWRRCAACSPTLLATEDLARLDAANHPR
jgi:hypothetical protein